MIAFLLFLLWLPSESYFVWFALNRCVFDSGIFYLFFFLTFIILFKLENTLHIFNIFVYYYWACYVIFSIGRNFPVNIVKGRIRRNINLYTFKLKFEKKLFLSWPFNIDSYRRWNDNTSNLLFKPTTHYIRKDEAKKTVETKPNEMKWNWQKHSSVEYTVTTKQSR